MQVVHRASARVGSDSSHLLAVWGWETAFGFGSFGDTCAWWAEDS